MRGWRPWRWLLEGVKMASRNGTRKGSERAPVGIVEGKGVMGEKSSSQPEARVPGHGTDPEVSVIVPISERHDDVARLYRLYAEELERLGRRFEWLFVVVGDFETACRDLARLRAEDERVRVVKLPRRFGESAALLEGFKRTKGDRILTLASYIQVDPTDLPKVFAAYEAGNDLVITRRFPRRDPVVNRIQSGVYHFLVRILTGVPFKDITCGMRLINRKIVSKLIVYGDLHRFIPVFAALRGIKIAEVIVSQRQEDVSVRMVKPGIYVRRILDIVTLFFLVKFTKKPLRFFGLVGSALFVPGLVLTAYLAVLRLLGVTGLADRPLLLLGMLLMVFGIQIFSIGLVGELIVFSHAREMEDYEIEEIIE